MKTLQHVLFALGIDRQDINQATTPTGFADCRNSGLEKTPAFIPTAIEATVFSSGVRGLGMYVYRLVFLLILAIYLFSPVIMEWWIGPQSAWYRPIWFGPL